MPKIAAAIITATLLGSLVAILYAIPLMLIWNNTLVAAIPSLKEISLLQAMCIVILVQMFHNCKTSVEFNTKR
jgi:hypothetical protein